MSNNHQIQVSREMLEAGCTCQETVNLLMENGVNEGRAWAVVATALSQIELVKEVLYPHN